jgi:hypothetical protein
MFPVYADWDAFTSEGAKVAFPASNFPALGAAAVMLLAVVGYWVLRYMQDIRGSDK